MPEYTLAPSLLPGVRANDDVDDETPDPAEILEAGECPWCDDYSGENPSQHAARAHRDEWTAYKEATE